MATIVVTGANRGLGLEFVRQFAGEGWRVHAGCRNPADAPELAAIAKDAPDRVEVSRLDVTDEASIAAFAAVIEGSRVDLLINNAGVYGPTAQELDNLDVEGWLGTFRTNTVAPLLVTRALLPALTAGEGGVVVVITSRVGSITEAVGGRYAYRTSKAAANMVVKMMAVELADRGLTIVAMHPGWVRTDMGGAQAPLTTADSVGQLRGVIAGLGPDDSGRFLNYDGAEIPW
jgi:NAD(P)-dependent dehydrogenase (short-subunit alcohol dehydrogenase family)